MSLPTVILKDGPYNDLPVTPFNGTKPGDRVLMGPTGDVEGYDVKTRQFQIAVYLIEDDRVARFSHMEVISGGAKIQQ